MSHLIFARFLLNFLRNLTNGVFTVFHKGFFIVVTCSIKKVTFLSFPLSKNQRMESIGFAPMTRKL